MTGFREAGAEALVKAHAEAKQFGAHLITSSWNMGQLFAVGFFICSFLVNLFPLMSVWDVAFDTHVTFWFGNYPFWWTLPIPLMFLVVFAYHMKRHHPKRKAVMMSIIIPCVVFFLLGASLKVKSDHLMDHIIYDDCGTHSQQFRDLDMAATEAEKKFAQCNPSGFGAVTLENCPDFAEWRKPHAREWDYLQFLENDCGCTNFCHSSRMSVWTPPAARAHDACSNCVLSVMRTKVQHVGNQLMLYAILILVIALVWLRLMKNALLELGAEMRAHIDDPNIPHSQRSSHSGHQHEHVGSLKAEAVFVPAPAPLSMQNVLLAPRSIAAPVPGQSLLPVVMSNSMSPRSVVPQTHRSISPSNPGMVTSIRSEPAPSIQPLHANTFVSAQGWPPGPPKMMSAPPAGQDQEWADVSSRTLMPSITGRL